MKVGLVDVDGHNFPNLCLMKLSAWHKAQGDEVEWYAPLYSGHLDRVYMSKVFSFSDDYSFNVDADEVIKGGSGYCIEVVNGREVYNRERDILLPDEVEHIYPDYSIYHKTIPATKHTAYGFLTRGCPRGCEFCHVACKEGQRAYKVADLDEFWSGQSDICLCDPNITAAPECLDLFDQLIASGARVEFNQGLDIRLMTEAKAEKLKQMKVNKIHFAWDRYEDKDIILPKFEMFKDIFGGGRGNLVVYVLANFNTTTEQDLERCYLLRDMDFAPYLTIYNKDALPKGHVLRHMQRYVNNYYIFYSEGCRTFEDYKRAKEERNPEQLTLF